MKTFPTSFAAVPGLLRVIARHTASLLSRSGMAAILCMGLSAGVQAASLTVEDGVTIKFGSGAGITVHDALHTGQGVTLTSLNDSTVGGTAAVNLPPATAGDWRGLTVTRKVDPADLVIDNIVLRYAGGNAAGGNGAALSIKNRAYHFNALTINNSVTALRVDGFDSGPNPGSPTLTGTTLTANQIGMVVDNNAAPSITQSNIYSNTSYGVLNNTPATVVDATQNWWGHASGPKDPINNPSGSGNAVSTGVDYGQFTANRVLAGCTILPANGSYVTTVREVTFNLYCPLANQVRLGETANITSSYVALTAQRAFTLSSTVGEKQVYAQFRASSDGAVTTVALPQPMVYNPAPFSVTITAPPANATLTENTTISAVVISALSITKVEFFIDGVSIGTVTAPPYNRVWNIASATAGTHTIKVVATDSDSQTAEATRTVTVQKGPIDTEGPALTPTFAGQALVNGATITTTGTLALSATDPSGVKRLEMKLDGVSLAQTQPAGSPTTASYSTPVTFDGIANGAHTLSFIGEDTLGNLTTLDIGFTLTLSAPPAPTITSPASGANVSQPNVAVSGQAAIGSQVQLYLNGAATGGLINADSSGRFSGSVVLPGEGSHTLQADARNSRGTSARSAAVNVTYTMAAPTVSFVSPAANIVLSASVEIAVLTTDPGGTIQSIVLSANGTTLTTLTSGETSFLWDIADVADGAYTLKAVATSSSGKTAEATRNVTVKHIIPEVLTPYTGEVLQALPAVSYGWDAVTISGRAKDRATNESVANIALRLVLQVGSFQRKINVVTDEAGNFTFRFDPQATDAGTYQLAALHPDETKFVEQARFTINRLSTNISTYSLNAARTIAYNIPISVAASAGTGSHGVRWEARAEDQPSGSVPPGISINGGSGVDVPASRSVPVNIAFNGNTPLETGTIIFTLVASDTGNVARAKLTLNWRLSDPQPALAPSPTYIQTGTQQNIPVSATVTLTNKGLAAAHNVRVQLQTSAGGLNLPDWISLGSSENLGTLEVGDKQILQVNVAPGTAVSDGFYYFRIWVSADNAAGGQIPITVAVSQAGEAGVRFEVSDLYTNTLDDKGQVILGVNNALITVQNEVVTNIQRSVRSNAQGIAEIQGLPPGTYRYNASATNRISTSGRFQMLAGITIPQPVFLDYQPINVEFRVNETTIRDVYEITINATYQTQVPAPVVVLTPTAINLPSMQVGEEITGELTLSNNGLVRADNLVFTPPKSDEYYHYEFKTDSIPSQLEAKTRITIPYKVTAKQAAMGKAAIAEGSRVMLKAQADGSIEKQTMEQKSGTCHSYSAGASAKCEYECANGQWSKSCGSSSGFYRTIGSNCGSGGGSSGGGGGGGGGWGGGGGGYTPGPVPMTPKCDPECEKGECC